jgi:hypothetical protein
MVCVDVALGIGVALGVGVSVNVEVEVEVGVSLGGRRAAVSVGCVGTGGTPSVTLDNVHAVMKIKKQIAMRIPMVRLCKACLLYSASL